MAKYSYEFKLKIVQAYLNGEGGYRYLAKKYNMPSQRPIEFWVHAYNTLGKDGLMRSRQNNNYSFHFKLNVVELYLSSEVSYQELALMQGINNPALITRWVNDFRIAGPDALSQKKKGRKKTLDISEVKKFSKATEERPVDTSIEHVRELEDELLKLNLLQIHEMLNGLFDKLPTDSRPIFHSDQGWQYQHAEYQRLLKEHNIIQSMSRKGICMDNGAMENFFGRLKVEMFYGERFENVNAFIDELKKYIHYYNNERISLKLKGMSPVQYRTHSQAS